MPGEICKQLKKMCKMVYILQEHDLFSKNPDSRYEKLKLVEWKRADDKQPSGYYASYKIGAEWIDEKEGKAIVVTPKRGMENIDVLEMFMQCFTPDLAVDSFSQIYSVNLDKPTIDAPELKGIIGPLIAIHFLKVVDRIKYLKKGYVRHSENLKKQKGHIKILENERTNIAMKRYDRIYCDYDEYSLDIPENRLIKKALLFIRRIIGRLVMQRPKLNKMKLILAKNLIRFENVSDEVNVREVVRVKGNKLFREYQEAIRLAKIIIRYFDYNINKSGDQEDKIVPFTLDMSLLYEHYVYGLLYEAYHHDITYQFKGKTGYPDFLYQSENYKAILDAKYIPKYQGEPLDNYVIRQLSGYSRDLTILKYLGYPNLTETSHVPDVPCIILYPTEGNNYSNPFLHKQLEDLCSKSVSELSQFYKISIPIPILKPR